MPERTYHLVSLGCAKNTVDSHAMAQLLWREGYISVEDPEEAALLIVNTCGFIEPAREESFQVLRELAAAKRDGQKLIAAGCLTQRYGAQVADQVKGIDAILGTRRWMDILDVVQRVRAGDHPRTLYHLPGDLTVGGEVGGVHQAAIQGASAYLKIADGCRRPCAFCAIPLIKGTAVSRPIEAILQDAVALQEKGVRELVLIAQDTTDYGRDLGLRDGLPLLLERLLERAPHIDWIRVMYAYPGAVSDGLIQIMAKNEHIVPYLDMPLQHAHPGVLRRMRRPSDLEWVRATLAKMRALIPGLALRSTFIVGYPGETEAEFQTLLDFLEEMRFDRVGAFLFSFEAGTASQALGDPVPAQVKQERYNRLMEIQQRISLELNQGFVGRTLDALVEGSGDGLSLGRTYRDAPEIDGMVIIEGELPSGEIVPVRITGAMVYDFSGVVDITLGDTRSVRSIEAEDAGH